MKVVKSLQPPMLDELLRACRRERIVLVVDTRGRVVEVLDERRR